MTGAEHDHRHDGLSVEVEREGATSARVHFTVTSEEFERTVRRGLQGMARRVKMKGFRPGKVPPAVLERRFGEEVRRDAVRHFLSDAYQQAVDEHGLRPAAHPRVDLDALSVEPGRDLSHEFEVWLRPDIELGEIRGLQVERRPVEVTDEEVEAALEDVRRQRSSPEPVGDEGLPEDGMAVARLEFRVEGAEEPVLDRSGVRLAPGSAPAGVDPERFRAEITGKRPGDAFELPMTIPEGFPSEAARGRTGTVRITLEQAFRIVAPPEEELFELFRDEEGAAVQDTEALRRAVAGRIREMKEEREKARMEGELLDQVVQRHPVELPGPYLEERVSARMEELRGELQAQGLAPEEIEARAAEEEPQVRASTEKAVRAVWLMEEIARREGLLVKQADLEAELRGIAQRNQVPLEEVRKYYQEQGLDSQLALELLERKVRSFLVEAADIQAGR